MPVTVTSHLRKRHHFAPEEAREAVRKLKEKNPDHYKTFSEKGHLAQWGKVWEAHAIIAQDTAFQNYLPQMQERIDVSNVGRQTHPPKNEEHVRVRHILYKGMSLPATNDGSDKAPTGRPSRNAGILATLVVAILILGSIAVYQQLQISNLSRSLSHQSSEFANPTSDIAISNFTVTKLNATDRPVMYLVFLNNGTSPASSLESLLVGVYAANNNFQPCYNNTQSFFPLFSNESVMIVSPLNCGEIGNKVVLTATVDFLTDHGTATKVYSTQTTITQSDFPVPVTVVVNQIGIKTYVVPEIIGGNTAYNWLLVVTNNSPTPIVSVNETAITTRGAEYSHVGCVIFGGRGVYGVSNTYPLPPNKSCQINNNIPINLGPFKLGENLQVIVGIKYLNGSTSTAATKATVIPPYALYE